MMRGVRRWRFAKLPRSPISSRRSLLTPPCRDAAGPHDRRDLGRRDAGGPRRLLMPFTLLDGILIFVVLISAVLAMIRGFTREVFSIGSWVVAAAATYFFWESVLPYTQRYIEDRNLALGVTIAGIFFITL